MRCDCCVAPSSGWKATSRTYFALNGHVGPEEKLPHRTLHMDERQRRLERFTFVELPETLFSEFYKPEDDEKAI